MIKLKDIILEESRTTSIPRRAFFQLYRTKCSSYDPNYHTPIYRGIKDLPYSFGYVDPSKHTRKSAHTQNYYTLILDNSPKWKRFPKRSKSIICSTDKRYAGDFGVVYNVIPFDGSIVGVCSKFDIWRSFRDSLENVVGFSNASLEDINGMLSYVYKSTVGGKLSESSFETLKKQINKLPEAIINTRFEGDMFFDEYQKSSFDTLYEFIEHLFDPTRNGFQTVVAPFSEFSNQDREVWTEGPCLLVKSTYWQEFLWMLEDDET